MNFYNVYTLHLSAIMYNANFTPNHARFRRVQDINGKDQEKIDVVKMRKNYKKKKQPEQNKAAGEMDRGRKY